MLASVLGESGDIFFPKLDENKDMIPFDKIAKDLLSYIGLETDQCNSELEAKNKALLLTDDSKKYPVYFFGSETSGEKTFEEFFTENEILDLKAFDNLGVIKNSVKRDLIEIDLIFKNIEKIFLKNNIKKSDIVDALNRYLPNFDHIETGKHLDQKM